MEKVLQSISPTEISTKIAAQKQNSPLQRSERLQAAIAEYGNQVIIMTDIVKSSGEGFRRLPS